MCCCFALPCLYDRICIYLSADAYLREGVSLWWLQDTRFKIPRVNMHCSIESVRAEKSPRWMGMLHGCILYWYRYTVGFKIKFPLPPRCKTVLRCLPFPFRFRFLTVFLLPSENTFEKWQTPFPFSDVTCATAVPRGTSTTYQRTQTSRATETCSLPAPQTS